MTRATATLAAPTRVALRGAHRDRRAASTRVSSTNASVTADVESLAAWVTDQGGDVSATIVGEGERGRGLFASRDLEAGEVVLRVPIGSALNDGRAHPPYPGAPWSVVLAAELLRGEQRLLEVLGLLHDATRAIRNAPASVVTREREREREEIVL